MENSQDVYENVHVNAPIRAHRLDNGDIFTVKDISLQFENMVLYEVVFSGYDEYMQSIWIRTGRVFSIDELNEYCK